MDRYPTTLNVKSLKLCSNTSCNHPSLRTLKYSPHLMLNVVIISFLFLLFTTFIAKAYFSAFSHESSLEPRKSVNHLFSFFNLVLWLKLRVLYYVNNWVYTTNHKRIAVNYFWFVIFSGICGMVLATIIRLEMAYPGVGILAGDSLQYLSVVTAHAVIMVFFMIMPLLFGAWGNFLLPTQLGVHDVAFPRLNSAAFWFLPAGLLMLVQLVCLDRRYQRMNCYNIREIQTILKSKYTPNTMDSSDVRFSLNDTTLGLRYQLGELEFLNNSVLGFYQHTLASNSPYNSISTFINKPLVEFSSVNVFMSKSSMTYKALKSAQDSLTISESGFMGSITSMGTSFSLFFKIATTELALAFQTTFYSFATLLVSGVSGAANFDLHLWLNSSLYRASSLTPLSHYNSLNLSSLFPLELSSVTQQLYLITNLRAYSWEALIPATYYSLNPSYVAQGLLVDSTKEVVGGLFQEKTSDYRFLRSANPVFKYDFKVGNYMPDDTKKMNPHLFRTIQDLTTGVRKSSWFTSEDFSRLLQSSAVSYLYNFSDYALVNPSKSSLASLNEDLDSTFSSSNYNSTNATPTASFYNFFLLMSTPEVLNTRWVSTNALNQKFYRMFTTSSLQQRIYSNWRQLKFTREAWRCKLLAARHQNTMYKRYLNEDSVVWAVERNAKDVLPGWAMITPFSARSRFTAIGKVDIGLMGVFLVLNSSIVSSANFLVTYRYLSTLNNRKMRDARSFFTEGVMVASWMMIAANPMLAIGILMLLSDRHWQTSFFDYSGGGDTVLFQHMFWFFGHPEVYVIMIPGFGFNNTILSFYLRKRVSARASLLYSMYTIAFLGFFVWGHHMYMVGLAHTTRMLFSTLTVMISVPAATKLMHWCVTLVNSAFVIELPMFFQLLFIFFFVSGGISGMAVAHTGMDILFHDSFYVVGHFHVMLAGSAMFAAFGAFYFYFPAVFGVKFSRIYGYLHCLYYLIGQLMTVVPMFWLGYAAMPRRVLDYPAALGGWHAIVSAGHMLSVAGMMAFFIMIFDSMRQGRAATRNSFGVARFNTRLNFYIYEGARTWFLQRKGWYLSRFNRHNSVRLNKLNYSNHEYLETTLYSYVLVKAESNK